MLQIVKCNPEEPGFYILLIAIPGVFYGANWEEYHVGILRTAQRVGGWIHMGLTECQFILIFSMLLEGFSLGNFSKLTFNDIGNLFYPKMPDMQVQTKI